MNTIEQAREVLKRLRYGAYVDGRDLQAADTIDVLIAENDRLRDVMRKLLANADWRVGGALTPTSKRSDFQSSGYSIVKTRDLASVRDALGE